ncbi:MAG: Arginine/agmatine antiporter [Chlamydiia bacterium]|nr:Arginine/agmatine antiporter [Chlamydiia bacterium]MCH9615597.1 Arginine/agmatine antiporter [Chlamydiia bacterium]MCH9629000.1 Arginine/agmatine antiporter [Chlamydiia bacterium]
MKGSDTSRKIGFWILLALVVGNMIGSGIYLLPATLASYGSITLWSWVATSIGALLLALVFSRLSMMYTKTGGPYVYCREGIGDFIGFQVAYSYWIYLGVGVGAIAIAFTGYMSSIFPVIAEVPLYKFLVAAGIIWALSIINIIGVHFAGAFQLIMTILKIIPLVIVTVGAFFHFDPTMLSIYNVSAESNFAAMSSGAMLTLWAFLGLESACVPADEVKNPKRNIPLATILGVVIASVVYFFSTLGIMGVIPNGTLSQSSAPFATLAKIIMGPWGQTMVIAGALVACIGTMNGWILIQNQIALGAAKDGLFPPAFAKLNAKRSPYWGILISAILVTVLIAFFSKQTLVDQFKSIITMATLAAIIAYLYTSISEVILRKWRGCLIPILAFIYVYWVVASFQTQFVYLGMLLLLSSLPVYAWVKSYEPKENL